MIEPFGMEGTKLEIFTKSVELFAKSSYHAVNIKEIGRAAGIRSATIYYHFSSKDAILEMIYAYYDHYFQLGMPNLQQLLDDVDRLPPREVLLKLVSVDFEPEMEFFMHNLFAIISMEMSIDTRARDVLMRTMFEVPRRYFLPLFDRMRSRGLLVEFDEDAYLLLHSSLCHSTTRMMSAGKSITIEEWSAAQRFLIDGIVRRLEAQDGFLTATHSA